MVYAIAEGNLLPSEDIRTGRTAEVEGASGAISFARTMLETFSRGRAFVMASQDVRI